MSISSNSSPLHPKNHAPVGGGSGEGGEGGEGSADWTCTKGDIANGYAPQTLPLIQMLHAPPSSIRSAL